MKEQKRANSLEPAEQKEERERMQVRKLKKKELSDDACIEVSFRTKVSSNPMPFDASPPTPILSSYFRASRI